MLIFTYDITLSVGFVCTVNQFFKINLQNFEDSNGHTYLRLKLIIAENLFDLN